jgi:hypothetical protein
MQEPSAENGFQSGHAALLAGSFQRILGRPLHRETAADALYHAPFPILSHDGSEDPVLTYGNLAAQELWEMGWAQLTAMPSRLTAEPQHRGQRAEMFEQMRAKGFIDDYAGVRISASGRRFEIRNAIIWPLLDEAGVKRGEAAVFREFAFL